MFEIKNFLSTLVNAPGVYQMLDKAGEVIYVGKAKSLKKRVSSYFRAQVIGEKTKALVKQIAEIQVTVTANETDALLLEHNLIKQFRPRYNVLLRDDKSYPYIFLSRAKHPRLSLHRGAKKAQGDYFGPFPDAGAARQSLYLLQKIFPVRQCADSVYANRSRPCLMYQIGRCAGPCVAGLVSDNQYAELVEYTRLFLQGKDRHVIDTLVVKMEEASHALAFEQAAVYRDNIQALRRVQEQQGVALAQEDDLDVIGVALAQRVACIHVLFIRHGKVLGSRSYFPKMPANTDASELTSSFLSQFYLEQTTTRTIPRQILLSQPLGDELQLLTDCLSEIAGHTVTIRASVRGEKMRFVKLAAINAQTALTSKLAHKSTMLARFDALKSALNLPELQRIECFDISHTQGEHTVASCVVFNDEGPLKAEYRRYNITGITAGDDYAAMAQVLTRRYNKAFELLTIPDLILIDGGKGQLNIAATLLQPWFAQWPKQPLLIGVAKGSTRRAGLETLLQLSGERFYLPSDSLALHLIQQIRDESHDHAIAGHRAKRAKARMKSPLEDIEGVGPKRRQVLLKYLGGMQGLLAASVEEIAKVPGISHVLAEKIYSSLQRR